MATANRIKMMLITTIISISVTPRSRRVPLLLISRPGRDLVRPTRIRSAVARDLVRSAVHALDAGLIRIPRILGIFLVRHPGIAAGDVGRNELDVSLHDIFKRLGRALLVQRVLLDGLIERRQ